MPTVRGSSKWLAFATFSGAFLLSNFLRSTNAIIAEDLTRDLQLGASQLGIMTGSYFVPFAAAQLPVGSALDRHGAHVVVPLLMTIGAIGCVVIATAPDFLTMTAGRGLLGLGTAGILMGAFKTLSPLFPGGRFTVMATTLVAIGAGGVLLATSPLAWFSGAVGWRAVFAVGALALLLNAAAVSLWGRLAPTAVAPAGHLGFMFLLTSGRFWRFAFVGFVVTGTLFAVQGLWAGPYLTQVHGLPQADAGNVLLILGLGVVCGYLASGWSGLRYGLILSLLIALVVLSLVQMVIALPPARGSGVLTSSFFLFGLAAAFETLLFAGARSIFPEEMVGRVVTGINFFMFLGGFALQALLGLVIDANSSQGAAGAYRIAFLLTAGLSAAAFLALLPELRVERADRRAEP